MEQPKLKPRSIATIAVLLAASLALSACCPCWGMHDRYYDGPPRGYYR